ncbi:Translation protein, beta-barrel domain containing protein [Heracleum sosnowskyi]|uniref:Translation protein, beta-barrel domain containing protein n=1 Tax=Heracleum sosnowskyi TaxID=360622 RepID=A0AAD8MN02_9APIA|nr:Translation protein, beta-barrel domain containing protein [Heracleum sosnowskyi]
MQTPNLICSSNYVPSTHSSSTLFSNFQQFIVPKPHTHFKLGFNIFSWLAQSPLNSPQNGTCRLSSLHNSATQDIAETSQAESGFIEVGYISSVHGLQGEVRVNPSTGFPELRFSTPGKRWLRQQISGRETIQEVTLLEGRGGHKGQKSWILKLSEVDTVEQAQQLVGSTLLVTEEEKPDLEEGEFYTRDLVGMRVILKETGENVGTVVNVFDSGAGDLLQVRLNASPKLSDGAVKPESEMRSSAPLVWVPFVEAIVPTVDMNKREMLITPPKGLLELNVRSDDRSKKERRQLDWKERKKFQKRVVAAKKKLSDLEQQHVFHGFRRGGKSEGALLANQIVNVNHKLLRLALQNIETSSKRWDLREYIEANLTDQMRFTLEGSGEVFTGKEEKVKTSSKLLENGKVAIVVVMDDTGSLGSEFDPEIVATSSTEDSPCLVLQSLLSDDHKLIKDLKSVPLIFVSPANVMGTLQNMFSENDHFGFDDKKVWFLEEEKLPVVSKSVEELEKHKILMQTPWEILQVPVGSGGVFSSLSSDNIVENLSDMGVEFIEVCAANQIYIEGQLVGLVHSRGAHIGIRYFKNTDNNEDNFHMIFSMDFVKKLTKDLDKLHLQAIEKPNPHICMVDKEWIDITPSSNNSYEFHSSIYSTLKASVASKVCLIEVQE